MPSLIGTPQLVVDETEIDDRYYRSYTRTYKVYATTDADSNYVRSNLGVSIFNTYPTDTHAFVNRIGVKLLHENKAVFDSLSCLGNTSQSASNGTACLAWQATVSYGPWNPLEHTDTGDPTAQPLRITMNGVAYEKQIDQDVFGNPIVNTAGDYFDPPVTRDQTRCTIEVTRNELGFSPSTIFAYANKTNLATWNGFPPQTIKVAPPRVVPQWSQFSFELYSEVTYTFEFDPDGWVKVLLNQGTRYLSYSGGGSSLSGPTRRFNVRDDKGELAKDPALLDALGRVLGQPINSANVLSLAFQVYPTLDFTLLGLDPIFTY